MTAGQKESADGLVPIGSEHCLRKKKRRKNALTSVKFIIIFLLRHSSWRPIKRISTKKNLMDIRHLTTYIRGCQKFGFKVYWRLQFLGYLRTLSLKFQKAWTKIEVVLNLPCWLSQFSCSLQYTLIPWSLKNVKHPNLHIQNYLLRE